MKTNKYLLMYLAGSLALLSSAKWAIAIIHHRHAKAEKKRIEIALQTWEGEGGLVLDSSHQAIHD